MLSKKKTMKIIIEILIAKSWNYYTFEDNNTRHASHKNSAPRRVFDFIKLSVSYFFHQIIPES